MRAAEMARALGAQGCVVGIERDPAQIAEGRRLAAAQRAGSDTYQLIVTNCRAILTGARETIVAHGGISATQFDAGIRTCDAWCARPDASYWYCTFWAEGTRKT